MHFILHQRGILYLATAVDQFGLSSIQNCNGYIELIYFHLFYGNIMDVDLSNIKKWVIVYPIYINSKKTLAEGRRINASKACENPTCTEVYDCCAHLKIPRVIEAYPRDFMQRGRVSDVEKGRRELLQSSYFFEEATKASRCRAGSPTSGSDEETGARHVCCRRF
ncbi:signal recognition particle SEC65 subunit-like [Salvia splendens]|uniref:signal recognition particle SEC65 subunit-like n=1 Tax=Salvia splendens TaxID=180675 RepID=UPI001C25F949|nr:signal recognition particle SEC65 subunit-like [Salvia splendens]